MSKLEGNAWAVSAGPGYGCKNLLTTIVSTRKAAYFITVPVFRYKLHCRRWLSKLYLTTNTASSCSLNVAQKNIAQCNNKSHSLSFTRFLARYISLLLAGLLQSLMSTEKMWPNYAGMSSLATSIKNMKKLEELHKGYARVYLKTLTVHSLSAIYTMLLNSRLRSKILEVCQHWYNID